MVYTQGKQPCIYMYILELIITYKVEIILGKSNLWNLDEIIIN